MDPSLLRSELPMFNETTANPKIVKILHGCDSDIKLLQRVFSIYLRNVFDTHQTGKLLGFPRLSLAWLLSNFCGIDVKNNSQLADRRFRTLPMEMMFYARQETRYLLYSKNELISKGNSDDLLACLHQSKDICKKRLFLSASLAVGLIFLARFVKPCVMEESHLELVRKARANLNIKQIFCIKVCIIGKLGLDLNFFVYRRFPAGETRLPGWRTSLPIPREKMQGILACCNPVPPLVKQNLGALHIILLAASDSRS